ncbi:dTDP-4-dehydrorhamnose reductase [Phyllobacterium brassicacearum]|uniref:dTDP-4-dehydrorhamnose reductase n=1 Tax=Phyllobacterium brassicacearum TaxID=314235 RepID=A0A2P7BBG6_9HYPH|nr:dTDP-4-dehydrorhamnose reductase [Phyllobacterium brassicacearum]PSH63759.1 dTDP-4-dehydrorhamnose reductase [Phyllobacterium brassicacearum]TDQ31956.1 dTDP-4-dehydrorhamnose reductase [Phyllobacterium brassicacearum]
MRIVVTGREGQVVSSLVERAALDPSVELLPLGRPELDLTQPETVYQTIRAARPDLVVSAAAYTAVDQAEDEPDLARSINETGAGAVAQAAADIGAPVIHLSTDYVFSGDGEKPYTEHDPTGPHGVYGWTKLDGEVAVAGANLRHLILRTAWVYSPFGKNFVKTMLRIAENRDSISVVADQWGNPTSAIDIADGILRVANRLRTDGQFDAFGVYHLAGTGSTNWSTFARAIFEASRNLRGPFAEVKDILTAEYQTQARRPLNSRLSSEKFHDVFDWRAPAWEQSMTSVVKRLLRA